jgi:hypothetical protein
MGTRIDTDLVSVVNAVIAQLIANVTLPDGVTTLNDSTCFYWIDDGENPPPSSSDTFLTVELDGGEFDESLFDGGGVHQVTEKTSIQVTVWSNNRLDPGMRDLQFLTNAVGAGGMLIKVLKALAGADLIVDGSSDTALRELVVPQRRGQPARRRGDAIGSIPITFGISYDWLLT